MTINKTNRKPAEIYIGERIIINMMNNFVSKKSKAIYIKPDDAPNYIQVDVMRVKNNYEVQRIHQPTGLPENYEVLDKKYITKDLLRIFDLQDLIYK